MSLTILFSLLTGCSGGAPEIPEAPVLPDPEPYRSIDDLPGPHPMPVPTDPDSEVEAWTPVDPATLTELRVDACNPGMAPLFSANTVRDANLAGQVRRAALGCLEAERTAEARALTTVLVARDDAEPLDHYVAAKVLLAQRTGTGEDVCTNDAYQMDLHAQVAAAADPEVSARMIADEGFAPVRSAYRYKLAVQPGPDRLAERLTETAWFGPGIGAFGTLTELYLGPEGAGLEVTHTMDEAGPVPHESEIRWRLEEGALVVTRGEAETTYTLDEEQATLEKGDGGIAEFFDFRSECEA